jgi:DNA replication and repair protein RecF
VLLLDDVMSELDADRRAALVALLLEGGGQALVTTTDLDQIPGGDQAGIARLAVVAGELHEDILVGEPAP